MSDSVDLGKEFPSIEAAYDFVLPSYDQALTRMESAENRIQSLVTLATALTAGLPVVKVVFGPAIEFISIPFIFAILVYLGIIVVGATARAGSYLTLVNPGRLFDQDLWRNPIEFKKNAIHHAGTNFGRNKALIRGMAYRYQWMLALLGAEFTLLLWWLLA